MAYREKDYVSRQIAILARILARVLGLKEAGRLGEARAEIERGAGSVLGLEYQTLERLDARSVVALLREREIVEAYVKLMETEADLLTDGDAALEAPGSHERVRWLRERAASLLAALPPTASGPLDQGQ
ncbi:MAG: hypothetical protein ACREOU_08420 [Candidatus Eiseniibacteriota bacterium]